MNSSINITRGVKRYELTNHLGNINVVLTDKRVPVCNADTVTYYTADVVSANDYSPFGAPLAGRTWYSDTISQYRFHFNGQEADDEIAGMGNIMSAEFWEYDTRLGRRWNCDPITYPWNSSYCVLNNNPISNIDPDGLESIPKPSGRGIGNRVYNGIGYVLMAIRNLFASSGNQRVWDYHPPTNNSNYSGWLKKILQPIC